MRDIDKDTLRQAAKVAKEQTDKTTAESVERIRQRNKKRNREEHGCPNCAAPECYPSCPRYLTHSEGGVFWDWWLRTNPAKMRVKEYLPLNGPVVKKGGRKSGRKRKKPPKIYKNPYLEV